MAKAKGPGRDLAKERRWRGLVAKHEKSGESIRGFCQREGLDEGQFYAWRRELRCRGIEAREKAGVFVPVKLKAGDVNRSSWALEIELGDVVKVRVCAGVEQGILVATLKALGVVGC